MKIRFVLLVILLVLTCSCLATAWDFDDGGKCGWEAGWKQVKGQYSYPPFAPFPPFPQFGQDDYRDGFAAGVLAGAAAAAR
jgi:hypothetical protein